MNALILVDIQNDFVPGGALAVPDGDKVVPIANALQSKFDLVVATQDWHPAKHGSFAAMHPGKRPGEMIELNGLPQVLWPVHCVQNAPGAEFVSGLEQGRIARVFQKGTDPGIDSYSGFFDDGHRKATGLGDYLKSRGVTDLFICGLATDYCVKFTVLDAIQLGFKVTLIEDACRGVNLQPGDSAAAIEEMKRAGLTIANSTQVGANPPKLPDITVTEKFVFFWHGYLGQWFRSPFVLDGVHYTHAEQAMMAEKARLFGDGDVLAQILAAAKPSEQKALGRKVRGFVKEKWDAVARDVVGRVSIAKFSQNEELKANLLATGEKILVEASPGDPIWGIGMAADNPDVQDPTKWRGTNWLGESLMRARAEIRAGRLIME